MEVHHHAHTARKKWTHYFWEFIMLFLAVFCGFFAEYQLEHKIEKDREKQYIKSLITDLEADVATLNIAIDESNERLIQYDSLLKIIKQPAASRNMTHFYYFFMATLPYRLFIPTRGTMDQLENAGGLRLIQRGNAADSITSYYQELKQVLDQGNAWFIYFNQFHEIAFRVIDYSQIDTVVFKREDVLTSGKRYSLLTQDETTLKIFFNKLFAMQFILKAYLYFLDELKASAIRTMSFLKNNYRIN